MTLHPKYIVESGKLVGVQLDVAEFEALLERLEEQEDLDTIRRMTAEEWETVSFEDYRAGADGVSG
ncbi:MAG: type II toxin-antitoxin system Phd/YefM family antitoxin [Planctomycetota bacterium]